MSNWHFCRLHEILEDYSELIKPLPAPITPMLRPFTDRVDEAINPGVVALTWTSIKIDECKKAVISLMSLFTSICRHLNHQAEAGRSG